MGYGPAGHPQPQHWDARQCWALTPLGSSWALISPGAGRRPCCSTEGHPAHLSPSPGSPLMEEEDIDGADRGHDPDQPTHVGGPGAQLPEVQPGGESQGHSLRGPLEPSPPWPACPRKLTPGKPCPLGLHRWDMSSREKTRGETEILTQ